MAFASGSLFKGLNAEQEQAVKAVQGPVLVLAGAGSGKTRVLISRIQHLLENQKVKPEQILALTFSNKAAQEMRERLKASGGSLVKDVWIGTFHALGLRILKENTVASELRSDFSVLDAHERFSILMGLARKHWPKNLKFDVFELSACLGQLREKGILPENCPEDTEYGPRLGKLYGAYEKSKRKAGQVDFEDLLARPLELFKAQPAICARYQNQWHYFHVDEFQDTNSAQINVLEALSGAKQNVFVVGDDDQSIYAWRGAELQNLLSFESRFSQATLLKLQQNYRSSDTIIRASNTLIQKNQLRRAKTVFTQQDSGEPLYHFAADDEKSEMIWLTEKIKSLHKEEGVRWQEMAVLVRTNLQLRDMMEYFIPAGIPFVMKGAQNLLELPEVQAVLAYAKVLYNPHDELSLSKVLVFPKRGFPKNTLADMTRSEEPVLDNLLVYAESLGRAWCAPLIELLKKIKSKAHELSAGNFYSVLESLLQETGVLSAFVEGEKKSANVQSFLRLLRAEEERRPEASLGAMLNTLALETKFEEDGEKQAVRLMTVHAAKGLEYEIVFLPNMDDDIFPSKQNHTDNGIEEERRLFYVAMTRAKRRLYFSWPTQKFYYRVVREVIPSRFLYEIPEEFWDGPLGKKDLEEKKAFIEDFFSGIFANLSEPTEMAIKPAITPSPIATVNVANIESP